jgi:DNA-binding winged helix-turn-helix (wHTH) protein/tetratricopeptide (TPR) repeat protein
MPKTDYRYRFADLQLDTRLGTLLQDCGQQTDEIKLPWLSYRLLCVLCEAAPGIVSQQTLIEAVWPDAVVGDETLKQRVKLLRKSLGDNASQPQYIEAIRGRGYRLLPQVEVEPLENTEHKPRQLAAMDLVIDSHVPDLSGGRYPLNWRISFSVLTAMLLTMFAIALSSHYLSPKMTQVTGIERREPSFADQLYAKGLEYYHRYRAEDNRHAIDLFHSAIEIAPQMAKAHAALADAYSQGVFQFDGPTTWRMLAIDSAYQAVALDPSLAAGYKALGLAYYNQGWLAKAIQANLKALQKQPDYNEAMSNLGYIYRELGQLHTSLEWADKALAAQPDNSVSMVHKALTLTALGDYAAAFSLLGKALLLQPDSQLANDALGQWFLTQGQFNQAEQHYRQLLVKVKTPNAGPGATPAPPEYLRGLAQSLMYLGEGQEALTLAEQLQGANNQQLSRQGSLLTLLLETSAAATQSNTSSKTEQAELAPWLDALSQGSDRPADSWALAQLYASRQDGDNCRRYLIQAINQGWFAVELTLKHPSFAWLLDDKHFQRLIDEMRWQRERQRALSRLTPEAQ